MVIAWRLLVYFLRGVRNARWAGSRKKEGKMHETHDIMLGTAKETFACLVQA